MQAQDGGLGMLRWVFLGALMCVKSSFMQKKIIIISTSLSTAHTRLGTGFVYNLEYAR